MILRIGVLLSSLWLSACAGVPMALTVAGSTIAGAKAGYDFWGQVTADTSHAIQIACNGWIERKASAIAKGGADALKAQGLTPWLDPFCDPNNPPPKDPIAGAVWVAVNSGKLPAP